MIYIDDTLTQTFSRVEIHDTFAQTFSELESAVANVNPEAVWTDGT